MTELATQTMQQAAREIGNALTEARNALEAYVEQPATMTHAVVPEADRLARGITPGLIRMSVGLEGPDVLMRHLDAGLGLP